jgi:hypothetical protein
MYESKAKDWDREIGRYLNIVVQSAGRVYLPVLIIILLDCKEAKMPDPMDDEHQPSATL